MRDARQHLREVWKLRGADPSVVSLPLSQAAGRVCAEPVLAPQPSPLFNNSQMDGFALSAAHLQMLPTRLKVGPTVAAGADVDALYPNGLLDAVAPVMTGARLPVGCVAVVPVERCVPGSFADADREGVWVPAVAEGLFVRERGSDVAAGDLVLEAGARLDALALAALRGVGVERVPVWQRRRAVVCFGGAEVGGSGPAQVPEVNGSLLSDLCATHGIEVVARVRTDDRVERLRADLRQALRLHRPDVVVTSGGISHGRFEVVRQLLEGEDVAWFGHVAQQPGGPQGLAVFDSVPVVCLPGNPISTLVSFRLFVAPVWGDLSPRFSHPVFGAVSAFLDGPVEGLPDTRVQLRRAFLRADNHGSLVVSVLGGGSSHLLAQAASANALAWVEPGARLERGDVLRVVPLNWFASPPADASGEATLGF
ncbi:MAG: molybdopterin molybdotransferase MoeA [Actinomycetaceae bacterium]|nr:molybdopterin molybdotransferase MoeA [Actinomycetaceae bacterium]